MMFAQVMAHLHLFVPHLRHISLVSNTALTWSINSGQLAGGAAVSDDEALAARALGGRRRPCPRPRLRADG